MMAVSSLAATLPVVAAKQSANGSIIYLFLIIGVAFYFLIYRPQQRKAKALREKSNAFDVGDEVLTAGGIVGHVIDIDGDRVTLETSVGASFVVLRQYIVRRLEPEVSEDEEEPEEQAELDSGEGEHGADTEDLAGEELEDGDQPDASDSGGTSRQERPRSGSGGKSGDTGSQHPSLQDDHDEPTGSDGPPII